MLRRGTIPFLIAVMCAVSLAATASARPPGMLLVPGGKFQMGDHHDGESDALPVHAAYVDSFYMDVYEVTNLQYRDFLDSAYSQGLIEIVEGVVYKAGSGEPYCNTYDYDSESRIHWDGNVFSVSPDREDHPVVEASWYGAAAYANWRSTLHGRQPCYDLSTWECDFDADGYRLPTEAEWEYAARGGEHDPYYRYPVGDAIDGSKANYLSSGDPYETGGSSYTTPVGYYDGNQTPTGGNMANGYGLYDVAGNVAEWCNDWYDWYAHCDPPPCVNPRGPESGLHRVWRGGSWESQPDFLRFADRAFHYPENRYGFTGVRLVLPTEDPPVPAVSTWGLAIMLLALLAVGSIVIIQRPRAAA